MEKTKFEMETKLREMNKKYQEMEGSLDSTRLQLTRCQT